MLTLVLGGQASGKSAHALGLHLAAPGPRLFVATGKGLDPTFRAQIAAHREERPADMPTAEADDDLAGVLARAGARYPAILVDALDFWLFTCLSRGGEAGAESRLSELLAVLDSLPETVVTLVSSETGLSLVPPDAAARAFVRRLGSCNRTLAARADRVHFVAAGLPLALKER